MDRERLKRLRSVQSRAWYETLIMRPLAILILYPIADWKFLTPNLMTSLANLCKLGGAALILLGEPRTTLWAFVILQVGVLFDHLDGTLARYQRRLTALGSLYDKASDLVTWAAIVLAIAWVASERTGEGLPFLLAAISTNALAAMGYMKWVARAESERLDWHRAKGDPESIIAAKTKYPGGSEPPERSMGDWLRWFGRIMINIFIPQEMDLYLWIGLLLLFDQHVLALWALVAVNGGGLLVMFAKRGWDMHKLDRQLKKARKGPGVDSIGSP